MNVNEDFWYINKSQKYIKDSLNVERNHLKDVVKAIYDTIYWLENSVYMRIANILHVELTDLPLIDTLALVGIDEMDNDVLLFINITHLVYLYENNTYKNMFLLGDTSCYDFACFITLHELGHLVHAILSNPGNDKMQTKIRNYLNHNKQRYAAFEEQIKKNRKTSLVDEDKVEPLFIYKKYRKLINEKQADNFAKNYLGEVISYNKKKYSKK